MESDLKLVAQGLVRDYAGRRAVDDRRKDEDRPPADWKPPGDDLDKDDPPPHEQKAKYSKQSKGTYIAIHIIVPLVAGIGFLLYYCK